MHASLSRITPKPVSLSRRPLTLDGRPGHGSFCNMPLWTIAKFRLICDITTAPKIFVPSLSKNLPHRNEDEFIVWPLSLLVPTHLILKSLCAQSSMMTTFATADSNPGLMTLYILSPRSLICLCNYASPNDDIIHQIPAEIILRTLIDRPDVEAHYNHTALERSHCFAALPMHLV